MWGAFLSYAAVGGLFNLTMHLQLYHRWRCARGAGGQGAGTLKVYPHTPLHAQHSR